MVFKSRIMKCRLFLVNSMILFEITNYSGILFSQLKTVYGERPNYRSPYGFEC